MWIPADRLLAVIDTRKDAARILEGTNHDRTVRNLRSGERQFIGLHVADRILTRLDLEYWFHISKEDGGLADIYEDGAQYGSPNNLRVKVKGDSTRRYATEEERVEARRRTYREYKRRCAERRLAA